MPQTLTQAQPPLEFIPPQLNPWVVRGVHLALPYWIAWRTAIADIQVANAEVLVELYRQFQAGNLRFMMAFRHPSVDDPWAIGHLLSQEVPRVAKQQGIKLQHPIHAHFIYDRGIPLWAGSHVGWLYSQLGGIPIHRGRLDRPALRSIRDLFANGNLPMMAAPEGATNGHNEIVSPLEPGIAQMGFWCIEDLVKAGRSEQVKIVPIGIQYRYVEPPWAALEQLLSELEMASGLPVEAGKINLSRLQAPLDPKTQSFLYYRLYRLGERLLALMEDFYRRFYHKNLPAPIKTVQSPLSLDGTVPDTDPQFSARLQGLLNAALEVAEQYFGVDPKGTLIDRCRRLEQAGWDWIYREDIKQPEALSILERGLADRIAEEASLRMWHMRLVESFVAVTGYYVVEKPTAERFAETALLLWDVMSRMKGKNPFQRPRLGQQSVQITVGQPLSVSDRWETYQASRRGAKQAVADLTGDLQTALEKMIL